MPVDIAEILVVNAELTLEEVLESPVAWPKLPDWNEPPTMRRRKIKPFCINIVYYVGNNDVRVVAYAHERRQPGYWAGGVSTTGRKARARASAGAPRSAPER